MVRDSSAQFDSPTNTRNCARNYSFDDFDKTIEEFISLTNKYKFKCPLAFWKSNELAFPLLAPLAKKFLAVPASSASVERMFNISGHVFSNKRRRTGFRLFENLVFCKLNEHYL